VTTLLDRLWSPHVVARLGGGEELIAVDRVLLHERTGSAALGSLAAAGRRVLDPARAFAITDHIVDTRPGRTGAAWPGGDAFYQATSEAARAAGLTLIDLASPDQGIVHVISPELGIVLPGLTLVCPDSHSCTQGAWGALAWGIGTTEAEHALATGTLRMRKPAAMRVRFEGALPPGVTAKDLMLALLAREGAAGGRGAAVEFAGSAVDALDLDGRQTLCNMATEFAAVTGFIAPDEQVFAYLRGRRYAPAGRVWERAAAGWRNLRSDAHAEFEREVVIDAGAVEPMVSWGTSPQSSVPVAGRVPAQAQSGLSAAAYAAALRYIGLAPGQHLAGTPIDGAYIGSCTNARLSDLRAAADVVRGRRVAPGVRALVVPGSMAVRRAAEAEGLDRVFTQAGFEWRMSGCGLCFYAGGETYPPGARVISSTNRNFEGRQGPGVRTHIASPATVAASALAGCIADARAPSSPWSPGRPAPLPRAGEGGGAQRRRERAG
jgi:3-isopropylmalate/(R)-2-methylmalate dehydratase large subunit